MTRPQPVEAPVRSHDVLLSAVTSLPGVEPDGGDPSEEVAFAALAVLSEPSVMAAALGELGVLERIALAAPHLVAVEIEETVEQVKTYDPARATSDAVAGTDEQGAYWLIESTTRRNIRSTCPDCTRGTYSLDGVLICIQLPARVGTLDGQPGDIVACGRER